MILLKQPDRYATKIRNPWSFRKTHTMPYRLCFFFFLYGNVIAQDSSHLKMGASLKFFLYEGSTDDRYIRRINNEAFLPVFIEVNDIGSFATLSKRGVAIGTITKNIATANIPLQQVSAIAAMPGIKRIELPLLFRKTDTLTNKLTGAGRVLNGDSPLPGAFTGKNVLIGIIDDGIDITHPEFLDASGKTKLRSLWNMDYSGGTSPPGYFYGHAWASDSINAHIIRYNGGQIPLSDMKRKFGYSFHGTPVTGLAAGNSGIAPRADIVSVALTALGDTILHSDRIIDAIAYIYSKAQEADKKCVINISLGLMDGAPHDGKSMVERAIDNFCEDKPDILVCTSAGNYGNTWKHWGGFPIHADSSFGFFKCAYSAPLYFSIPKQYSNTLRISLTDSKLRDQGAPNFHRDSIFAQTPYLLVSDLIQNGPVTINTFLPNGTPSSRLTFTAAHANDDYDELIVNVSELTSVSSNFDFHLYRFIWKGTGMVHAWFPFFNLHPAFVFSQNPYPNDPTYRSCDNDYTTVIPSHAYTVLSTGAYNVRNCYVNIQGNVVNQYPKCQLAYFTSRGPTADGRIKPDIINPGDNVLAPRSRMETFVGHEFILSANWESFGGTSASSPISAGMAALIWEAHPNFIRDSVVARIKNNTYTDAHTNTFGPVPNNVAGAGKADVFKALTGISTSYQSICDQWIVCNPTNNPPTNPPVTNQNFFKVFPNPSSGTLFVSYRSAVHLRIAFYNSLGQMVKLEWLQAGEYLYKPIDLNNLASGPYYMKVSDRNDSFTETILIVR